MCQAKLNNQVTMFKQKWITAFIHVLECNTDEMNAVQEHITMWMDPTDRILSRQARCKREQYNSTL